VRLDVYPMSEEQEAKYRLEHPEEWETLKNNQTPPELLT
jgi:hypothetical protein